MNLEQYMIPTPAEESDWSDLKATLLTGGVMLAPFGIAAVINAFKQAKYRKMDKRKSLESSQKIKLQMSQKRSTNAS